MKSMLRTMRIRLRCHHFLRLFITCILASFNGFFSACATPQKKIVLDELPKVKERSLEEVFQEGITAFEAGKYDDAKTTFASILPKAPDNAGVRFNLALTAEKQGHLAEAISHYEAAYKLDPNHKPTLFNLSHLYRMQNRLNDAIALYENTLEDLNNKYDVELNNNLAVLYRLSKQYAAAEVILRTVLSRTKDNLDAYKNLALIYFEQGNYRLAEFISNHAKKLAPQDSAVLNNLGLVYLKIGDRPGALSQFQKTVTLDKSFTPGLFNIGTMALSYRDYEGAEKFLKQTMELNPTNYINVLAYAQALDGQKTRNPKKGLQAGEAFERVLTMKTHHAEAICGAAWAYAVDKAGWDKSLQYLKACKELKTTTMQDKGLIDNRIKSIMAMKKNK